MTDTSVEKTHPARITGFKGDKYVRLELHEPVQLHYNDGTRDRLFGIDHITLSRERVSQYNSPQSRNGTLKAGQTRYIPERDIQTVLERLIKSDYKFETAPKL